MAMELTDVTVVTVVETLCPLPLLLSACVEAERGRWLTVAGDGNGADGWYGGDGVGDAVATAAAVGGVSVHAGLPRRLTVADAGDGGDRHDGGDGGGDAVPTAAAAVCVC